MPRGLARVPRDSARLAERIWAKLRPAIVELIEADLGGDEPSESAETLSADEEARIEQWLARKRQRDKQAPQGKRGAKGKAT